MSSVLPVASVPSSPSSSSVRPSVRPVVRSVVVVRPLSVRAVVSRRRRRRHLYVCPVRPSRRPSRRRPSSVRSSVLPSRRPSVFVVPTLSVGPRASHRRRRSSSVHRSNRPSIYYLHDHTSSIRNGSIVPRRFSTPAPPYPSTLSAFVICILILQILQPT